jgi:hypothetical protein
MDLEQFLQSLFNHSVRIDVLAFNGCGQQNKLVRIEVLMRRSLWIIWSVILLHMPICLAEHVRVKAVDEVGVRVPDILVVVRSLDTHTLFPPRFLTDSEGQTPVFEVPPGLYQFVASCPFGIWRTSVTEMFVDSSTKDIILRVGATQAIDVITTNEPPTVSVYMFSSPPEKAPLAGIRVLSRGSEAEDEDWLQTDATGRVRVKLVDGPTILAVPIEGKIYTFLLVDNCSVNYYGSNSNRGLISPNTLCVPIKNSTAEIEVPTSPPRSSSPSGATLSQPGSSTLSHMPGHADPPKQQ